MLSMGKSTISTGPCSSSQTVDITIHYITRGYQSTKSQISARFPGETLQEAYAECAADGPIDVRRFITWYRDHFFQMEARHLVNIGETSKMVGNFPHVYNMHIICIYIYSCTSIYKCIYIYVYTYIYIYILYICIDVLICILSKMTYRYIRLRCMRCMYK